MKALFNNFHWANISIKNRLLTIFSSCFIISSIASIIINLSTNLPIQVNLVIVSIIIINAITIYYAIQNLITDKERCIYLSTVVSFLPLAWIFNGGLMGSIPMYFFVYITASILCLTRKYRNYFLIYIVLIASLVTIIQIYFPQVIIPYHSTNAQLFDMQFSFILVNIILIIITFSYASITDKVHIRLLQNKIELQESYTQLAIAKELAEKATIVKTNFITNISHEIRTPLNGIVGISDLLQTFPYNEEQKRLIQTLNISSKTLLELINDLLDLSKIEANKLTIRNEIFEIRKTIDEIRELMALQVINKDIRLITTVEENTPKYIQLDRNKYKQILINLLSNAIKFTKKGTIKCKIAFNETKNILTTTVKDTGIGIEDKNIKKLFTPFTQLQLPKNITNNGIGMGLAITKKMLELMNGTINVKSIINKGSIFKFSIPTLSSNQTELIKILEDQKIKEKTQFKQFHLLICEDNSINQLVMSKMLDVLNHTYEFANNGQEAIECCKAKKFDIILMDIQMPVINGIDAAKIITEHYNNLPLKKPRIIICSANALQISDKEQLADIITDYMIKPINLKDLENIINMSSTAEKHLT